MHDAIHSLPRSCNLGTQDCARQMLLVTTAVRATMNHTFTALQKAAQPVGSGSGASRYIRPCITCISWRYTGDQTGSSRLGSGLPAAAAVSYALVMKSSRFVSPAAHGTKCRGKVSNCTTETQLCKLCDSVNKTRTYNSPQAQLPAVP